MNFSSLESAHRHQCVIYDGSPSLLLAALAQIMREKLEQNYRCLYLNSPTMVAGMRSYLAAAGVHVEREVARASLVFSASQQHLREGSFDIESMMQTLKDTLEQALDDGFVGLWASGDMTWELGPDKGYSKLMEYEWKLEKFLRAHPEFSGICQYHASTLPRQAMRPALLCHPSIFVNETLSLANPYFVDSDSLCTAASHAQLDAAIGRICQPGGVPPLQWVNGE